VQFALFKQGPMSIHSLISTEKNNTICTKQADDMHLISGCACVYMLSPDEHVGPSNPPLHSQ
jgi:hypothetical protein